MPSPPPLSAYLSSSRQPPILSRPPTHAVPHLACPSSLTSPAPSGQVARGSACRSRPSCPATPSASSRLAQVRPACPGPGVGTRAKPSGVIARGRPGRAAGVGRCARAAPTPRPHPAPLRRLSSFADPKLGSTRCRPYPELHAVADVQLCSCPQLAPPARVREPASLPSPALPPSPSLFTLPALELPPSPEQAKRRCRPRPVPSTRPTTRGATGRRR